MEDQKFDLEKLAALLGQHRRHPKLIAAIRQSATVSSAATDLQRASGHLSLLLRLLTVGAMPSELSTADSAVLIEAMFTAALIIYSRATFVTPISRQHWFGEDKLTVDERKTHETVKHLRQKEVAHFGKGMVLDGEPFLRETLYLRTGNRGGISFHVSTWANRPAFTVEFANLVQAVLAQATAKMEKRLRELHGQLEAIRSVDKSVDTLLLRCLITDHLRGISDPANMSLGKLHFSQESFLNPREFSIPTNLSNGGDA